MKVLKGMFLVFALIAISTSFLACGGGEDTTEKTGKEYTSAYVCPMHCEGSGSAEAGKCPVCGMDYVVNEKHKADGHEHDHDGESHDAGDHEGHDHDGHDHDH